MGSARTVRESRVTMSSLWLLKGNRDAPGWNDLQKDSKEDKVHLVIFDRDAWAMIFSEDPPTQYEGLVPTEPADGMYVSEQGYPIYVFNRQEVAGPLELIDALGEEARKMLEETKDPDAALERLGLAF